MDWLATLASAIGFCRLSLIFCGLWILLRSIFKSNALIEYQKKYFVLSGVIYLLGLTPQSVLLLLVSWDYLSFLLDSGYLCWIQTFACMISVALHSLIFFDWITQLLPAGRSNDAKCVTTFVSHKIFGSVIAIYMTILIMCRTFFLQNNEGQSSYADIMLRASNSSFSQWSSSPAESPAQVVRLELALCESTLSSNEVENYLITWYSLLILPIFLLCCVLHAIFFQVRNFPDVNKISEEESSGGILRFTKVLLNSSEERM